MFESLLLLSLNFLKPLNTSIKINGVGSIPSSKTSSCTCSFAAFLSIFPLAGFLFASSSFFLASSSAAFFLASSSAAKVSGLFGWGGRTRVDKKYLCISAVSLSNFASFWAGFPFLSKTTSSFFSINSSISFTN